MTRKQTDLGFLADSRDNLAKEGDEKSSFDC